ncbi:hypothetical protein F5Y09DRAFT_338360 [Xylaria sp. FL1042]|nr:hypothetical protein F5Y09DRAFT_338360 [Xylaria sp. FL1042]
MTRRLNAREIHDLTIYLENASASHISVGARGPQRLNCHGERRSTSRWTWHIGVRRRTSNGHHISCIVAGGQNAPEVEGSRIDHGTTQPSLIHVLNLYKRMYRVPVTTPSPPDSDDDNGNGSGGRGGSGSGGKGKGKDWSKKVKRDDYGGYYYIGPEGEYMICDEAGNNVDYYDSSARTYSYASTSSCPTYHPSYSGYSTDPGYATYSAYSTTTTQYPTSGSIHYGWDSTGRRYYVDQYGNTQWG